MLEINKVIIFVRHANREPITLFPAIHRDYDLLQDRIDELNNSPDNAQLIDKGRRAAQVFGHKFSNKYQLSFDLWSSPVNRCVETLQNITGSDNIKKDTIYKFHLSDKFIKEYNEGEEAQKILDDTKYFREYIELKLGVGINSPLEFYYIYSSMICYIDLGVDMNEYLPIPIQEKLYRLTDVVYNEFFRLYVREYRSQLDEIFNKSVNESKIICTHDHLIFALGKYLSDKYLPLPDYLSNIRIEYMKDGEIRVFYNNLLINNL